MSACLVCLSVPSGSMHSFITKPRVPFGSLLAHHLVVSFLKESEKEPLSPAPQCKTQKPSPHHPPPPPHQNDMVCKNAFVVKPRCRPPVSRTQLTRGDKKEKPKKQTVLSCRSIPVDQEREGKKGKKKETRRLHIGHTRCPVPAQPGAVLTTKTPEWNKQEARYSDRKVFTHI